MEREYTIYDKYYDAIEKLNGEGIYYPTDAEIADIMGVNCDDFDKIMAIVQPVSLESLKNEQIHNIVDDPNNREVLYRDVPSKELNAMDQNLFNSEVAEFRNIIRSVLTPAELTMVENYYYDNKDINCIAHAYNIPVEKVMEILVKSLKKLKNIISKKAYEFEYLGKI